VRRSALHAVPFTCVQSRRGREQSRLAPFFLFLVLNFHFYRLFILFSFSGGDFILDFEIWRPGAKML
jgi:hypothetical protein